MHGRTAVLISHRVAAIKDADQILVAGSGPDRRARHARRADRDGGMYAELYRTQLDTELDVRRGGG